jgi:hypothetical protein
MGSFFLVIFLHFFKLVLARPKETVDKVHKKYTPSECELSVISLNNGQTVRTITVQETYSFATFANLHADNHKIIALTHSGVVSIWDINNGNR